MRSFFVVGLLAVAACGRVGFASMPDGGSDGGGPPARIAHVAPFVQRNGGVGASESFTAQAHAAGDAIVIQVGCGSSAPPTGVAVSAPGWTFTQLHAITSSTISNENAATFGAIAPDTNSVTVAVSWQGSGACNISKNDVGDEFAMTDPAGGSITFDAAMQTEDSGTKGNCVGTVSTGHAGDAVWAACDSAASVQGVSAGFSKGADDGVGDFAEYRVTTDPAGAAEPIEIGNSVGYVLSMVTIKPAD
jgi:hypothetical protein